MYIGFGFLTACVSFYVLFHKFSESRSFILFVDKFPSIRDAWMTCSRGVMKGLEDVASEIRIVFKENFAYLNGICWSEEVIRE